MIVIEGVVRFRVWKVTGSVLGHVTTYILSKGFMALRSTCRKIVEQCLSLDHSRVLSHFTAQLYINQEHKSIK
jgi:hypothetical protein